MPRTFIDHLNHEIRSPLTVVVGMTELFSLSTLTDEQRQWLRTMQQAVQSILRLMDGAVDFSRLSANQLALRTEAFSLHGVLSEVRQSLAQNSSPTDLAANIQDGAPDGLIGDGARLRQALVGLAEHLILVRGIRRLSIDVTLRTQTAEAVTLDFAIGDADRQPAAPGSQSDAPGEFVACSEATVDRRRGLELAVAAGLAGAMQGGVWVAADKDAAVAGRLAATFALPSSSRSLNVASFDRASFDRASFDTAFGQELGSDHRPTSDAQGPKRILLAEDTRAIRQCLVSLLERHGHTVSAAKDGLQAVQILEREARAHRPFDVAILDLEMPVMDGWEAAREIRKRTAARPIRLIALTAHRIEGNPDLLGSADFDAAVGKPVDAERLFEAIASRRVSSPPPSGTPPSGTPPAGTPPAETPPETHGDCAVDYAGALARLCGNEQLLDDLVQFFLNDSPELLAEARAAIGRRDAKSLERTAHSIRGLASNFGAQPTVNAAAALEELGHGAALDDAESAYQDLETEVRRLAATLERRAGSSASRGDLPR